MWDTNRSITYIQHAKHSVNRAEAKKSDCWLVGGLHCGGLSSSCRGHVHPLDAFDDLRAYPE